MLSISFVLYSRRVAPSYNPHVLLSLLLLFSSLLALLHAAYKMRSSLLLTLLGFLALSSSLPINDDECTVPNPAPPANSSTSTAITIPTTVPALPVSTSPSTSPSATPPSTTASTPTSSPTSGSGAPDADTQAAIDANNKVRAQHGLQLLTFNATLASFADTWAKHDASLDQMVHDSRPDNPDMGENLYSTGGGPGTYLDATNMWLGEASNYNGQKIGEGNFGSYGHYTQCLWHSTTTVGFGKATSASGKTYIVGRYFPAGNVIGQTPY